MGAFNSWPVVTIPGTPMAPQSFDFTLTSIVGMSTSETTGRQTAYDWGAQYLEASVSMAWMRAADAQPWVDFFRALNGPVGVFCFPSRLCADFPKELTTDGTTPRYWRLKSGTVKWHLKLGPIYGISFDVREAQTGIKPMTAATLSVWSAVRLPSGITPFNYLTWNTPSGAGGYLQLASLGAYSLTQQTVVFNNSGTTGTHPIPSDLDKLSVNAWFDRTLGGSGYEMDYDLYDVYLDVTYADSSTARVRADAWQAIPGTYPSDGVVVNGNRAIDGDSSPPSTYGTLLRTSDSGFQDPGAFKVYGFSL